MINLTASPTSQAEIAANVPPPSSTAKTRTLYKNCQQFEGLLISNLWSEMEDGISLTGFGSDPEAGTMQGLGIEEAAMGIASSGGLGLARMIYQQLAPKLRQDGALHAVGAEGQKGQGS